MFNLGADFDIVFYANPQAMFVIEAATLQFITVNGAACQLYGYNKDEFLQLTLPTLLLEENRDRLRKNAETLVSQQIKKQQYKHLKKDGTLLDVEILSYNINFWGKGAKLVIVTDITEQLINKHKLEHTLTKMARTLESISDGQFALSYDGVVVSWNKSAEALTGIDKEDIVGKNFWAVIPEAVQSGFYEHVEQAITSQTMLKYEEFFPKLDKWFYTSIYPSTEDVTIYFQDITELKKHQRELRLKNKHLEDIAYFNSHELRRPVANIMGLYHLLSDSSGTGIPEKERIIEQIQRSCEEIDLVIKRIGQTRFIE